MAATQFSSGDLLADRRADYARMLDEGGDPAAAAELMEQALERVADWAAGWLRLAEYREKAGLRAGAAEALQQVLRLDPQEIFGARLRLAALGAADMPEQPPSRYVEALFDDYADRFEQALLEKLDYSVPAALSALIAATCPGRRFSRAVDLGCGTGLLGIELRPMVEQLEGFDLSANMLAKADEKGIYDLLAQADLSREADACGLFSETLPPARADLVTAADVMMYLGSLEPALGHCAALAAPGGILAFSVEDGGPGGGYALAPSLRYVHSQAFVTDRLAHHGLAIRATRHLTIRMDAGKPVAGILFIAEKPA